jgi:hypothetical protein
MKDMTPKDQIKDGMMKRTIAADSDAISSSVEHDYRLRNFLSFLKWIVNNIEEGEKKKELHDLFCACLVCECSKIVFSEPFTKNDDNLVIVTELISDDSIILTALAVDNNESDLFNVLKEDFKQFRLARLATNRALFSIGNSLPKAINYLAFSITEAKKIKTTCIQNQLILDAKTILEKCSIAYFCEMVSFMEFEVNEPVKQIIEFCVKTALDFGSNALCKYLHSNLLLLKKQHENCLFGYGSSVIDLEKKFTNKNVYGSPHYTIDKKLIELTLPEKDQDQYYGAEIEESKRNYAIAKFTFSQHEHALNEYR